MINNGSMNPMMSQMGQMNPMMNPMMGQMQGMGIPMMGQTMGITMNPMMGMPMNPMIGGQMGPMMGVPMNPMMGMPMNPNLLVNPAAGNQNVQIGDSDGWNLIFEEKREKKKTTIIISPDKKVSEAINLYKIKSNTMDDKTAKFIFNGKQLFYDLTISQSGLQNNSTISVVSIKSVIGA